MGTLVEVEVMKMEVEVTKMEVAKMEVEVTKMEVVETKVEVEVTVEVVISLEVAEGFPVMLSLYNNNIHRKDCILNFDLQHRLSHCYHMFSLHWTHQ